MGRSKNFAKFLQIFACRCELDFHVLQTIIFRGWSVIAGATMLYLLPTLLNPVQLGFHYSFTSILALQIFFELGMSQVICQVAAHEVAHLGKQADGTLVGDDMRLDRLTSLTKLLLKWFGVAATLFFLVVALSGLYFFSISESSRGIHWIGPWILITFSTACNLFLSPFLALLEGMGRIGNVARLRLIQSICGFVAMTTILSANGGLWASTAIPVCAAFITVLWFYFSDEKKLWWLLTRRTITSSRVNWKEEIFPFQWRIAVSWASGYFIFQLFVPTVFRNQGAVSAGKLGLALAIFNTIQSVGMSWVYCSGPKFGAMISTNQRSELRAALRQAILPSVCLTTLACLVTMVVMKLSIMFDFYFSMRLPEILQILFIGFATIVNTVIFAFAVFIRSHKEEPLMISSIVTALLMILSILLTSKMNLTVTLGCYFGITLFVSLPWVFYHFLNYWKKSVSNDVLHATN